MHAWCGRPGPRGRWCPSGYLAPELWVLIVARIAMAAGGAALVPSAVAILRHDLPAERRGRAFGAFGAMMALSAALGPVVGGELVEGFGWRSLFAANLPILALSVGLGVFAVGVPVRGALAPAIRLDRHRPVRRRSDGDHPGIAARRPAPAAAARRHRPAGSVRMVGAAGGRSGRGVLPVPWCPSRPALPDRGPEPGDVCPDASGHARGSCLLRARCPGNRAIDRVDDARDGHHVAHRRAPHRSCRRTVDRGRRVGGRAAGPWRARVGST